MSAHLPLSLLFCSIGLVACTGGDKDDKPDPVEGCNDSQWSDGENCLDITDEVCDDLEDNDGNGLVDCADEACMGAVACPTEYVLEVVFDVSFAALGTGEAFEAEEESPAILLEAGVVITGSDTVGDWYVDCSGTMSGSSYGSEEWSDQDGGLAYNTQDEEWGVIVDWELAGIGANVQWDDECMVNLPNLTLALGHQTDTIYMLDEVGEWHPMFDDGDSRTVESGTSLVSQWENLVQAEPISWVEVY
jgi:hypothetical protein